MQMKLDTIRGNTSERNTFDVGKYMYPYEIYRYARSLS